MEASTIELPSPAEAPVSLIARLFHDIADGRPVGRADIDRAVVRGGLPIAFAHSFLSSLRWEHGDQSPAPSGIDRLIARPLARWIDRQVSGDLALCEIMELASAGRLGHGRSRLEALKNVSELVLLIEPARGKIRSRPGQDARRLIRRSLSHLPGAPEPGGSPTKGRKHNREGRSATPIVVVSWAAALGADANLHPKEAARLALRKHGFLETLNDET